MYVCFCYSGEIAFKTISEIFGWAKRADDPSVSARLHSDVPVTFCVIFCAEKFITYCIRRRSHLLYESYEALRVVGRTGRLRGKGST